MDVQDFLASDFDNTIAQQLLAYAGMVSRRGYVVNTLGNIAIRTPHHSDSRHGITYTKHRGVSLEEMTLENVVVTDVTEGRLLYGKEAPSIGHQLNRKVFAGREDINAVIHLHPDEVISYFSVTGVKALNYISADTALILAKPARVLEPNVNVETDAALVDSFIDETNCIIMPNHGVTTLGRDISEAYHRMTSVIAEVRRIIMATEIAAAMGKKVNWIPDDQVAQMYESAESVIYGD